MAAFEREGVQLLGERVERGGAERKGGGGGECFWNAGQVAGFGFGELGLGSPVLVHQLLHCLKAVQKE